MRFKIEQPGLVSEIARRPLANHDFSTLIASGMSHDLLHLNLSETLRVRELKTFVLQMM